MRTQKEQIDSIADFLRTLNENMAPAEAKKIAQGIIQEAEARGVQTARKQMRTQRYCAVAVWDKDERAIGPQIVSWSRHAIRQDGKEVRLYQRPVGSPRTVERSALETCVDALRRVVDERSETYQAGNGKWVSIQGWDGERCDIIHSDITTDCEGALQEALKALAGQDSK